MSDKTHVEHNESASTLIADIPGDMDFRCKGPEPEVQTTDIRACPVACQPACKCRLRDKALLLLAPVRPLSLGPTRTPKGKGYSRH